MELAGMKKCPICETDTGHVNNHVRMSSDGEHGPPQEYPDGWDRAKEDFLDLGDDDDQGDDLADDQGDDQGEDLVDLTVDHDDADFRDYECPECGESIEYFQQECSNEHQQSWVVVE